MTSDRSNSAKREIVDRCGPMVNHKQANASFVWVQPPPPNRRFPWGSASKPGLSRVHECDRRQTDRKQTTPRRNGRNRLR